MIRRGRGDVNPASNGEQGLIPEAETVELFQRCLQQTNFGFWRNAHICRDRPGRLAAAKRPQVATSVAAGFGRPAPVTHSYTEEAGLVPCHPQPVGPTDYGVIGLVFWLARWPAGQVPARHRQAPGQLELPNMSGRYSSTAQ